MRASTSKSLRRADTVSQPERSGDGPCSVTLHSSWIGIIGAYVGAGLMVAFAGALLTYNGPSVVPVIASVIAVVFLVVVLVDLPIASEFRRDGVVRRALARHQFVAWDDVTRLGRLRTGLVRTITRRRTGGLVAERRRRSYFLVDRMESQPEFDQIRRVLGPWADALSLTYDLRPADGRNPTWMHRRAKWRPDSAGG